jgi:hypothetical protein
MPSSPRYENLRTRCSRTSLLKPGTFGSVQPSRPVCRGCRAVAMTVQPRIGTYGGHGVLAHNLVMITALAA